MSGSCAVMGSNYSGSKRMDKLGKMFNWGFFSVDMNRLISGEYWEYYKGSEEAILDKAYGLFEETEKGGRIVRTSKLEADATKSLALFVIALKIKKLNGEKSPLLDYVWRLKISVDDLRIGKPLPPKDYSNLQKFFDAMSEYTLDETERLMNY